MTMKPENSALTPVRQPLDDEDIALIREVLLIGLASYGEVQKILNQQQFYESEGRKWPLPERILDPTGDAGTVSKFADALRAIQFI